MGFARYYNKLKACFLGKRYPFTNLLCFVALSIDLLESASGSTRRLNRSGILSVGFRHAECADQALFYRAQLGEA